MLRRFREADLDSTSWGLSEELPSSPSPNVNPQSLELAFSASPKIATLPIKILRSQNKPPQSITTGVSGPPNEEGLSPYDRQPVIHRDHVITHNGAYFTLRECGLICALRMFIRHHLTGEHLDDDTVTEVLAAWRANLYVPCTGFKFDVPRPCDCHGLYELIASYHQSDGWRAFIWNNLKMYGNWWFREAHRHYDGWIQAMDNIVRKFEEKGRLEEITSMIQDEFETQILKTIYENNNPLYFGPEPPPMPIRVPIKAPLQTQAPTPVTMQQQIQRAVSAQFQTQEQRLMQMPLQTQRQVLWQMKMQKQTLRQAQVQKVADGAVQRQQQAPEGSLGSFSIGNPHPAMAGPTLPQANADSGSFRLSPHSPEPS